MQQSSSHPSMNEVNHIIPEICVWSSYGEQFSKSNSIVILLGPIVTSLSPLLHNCMIVRIFLNISLVMSTFNA